LFGSVYANASYFITGEHRNYISKGGYFGRVTPIRSFDPGSGGWGAWEVAGRFSYLDMIDGIDNGGKEWNVTLGVNWYLFSQVRVTAKYVYAKVKDTGDLQRAAGAPTNVSGHANIFQLRAQLEF
jgi:phosphate-selective porin OprO/OprP